MKKKWRKIFYKLLFWVVAEVILNYSGLDKVSDYGEFLERTSHLTIKQSYLCT